MQKRDLEKLPPLPYRELPIEAWASIHRYKMLQPMARRLLPRRLTFPCQGGRHRVIIRPSGRISTPDHDWAAEKVSEALGLPPSPCARVLEAARSARGADDYWRASLAPRGAKGAMTTLIQARLALKRILRNQSHDEAEASRRALAEISPALIASPEHIHVWGYGSGLGWSLARIRLLARRRIKEAIRKCLRRRAIDLDVRVVREGPPWGRQPGVQLQEHQGSPRWVIDVAPSLGMLQARGLDLIKAGNRWFIALGIAYIKKGRLGILAIAASQVMRGPKPVILDMENPFPTAREFSAPWPHPHQVRRVRRPAIWNLAVEEADIRLPADLERR